MLTEIKIIKINCDECKKSLKKELPKGEHLPKGWTEIMEETYGRDRWDVYMRETGKHRCPTCSKKKGK
jgi:hypothetical protein